MYQLTAVAGLSKGVQWTISSRPLVIGRDNTCDVTIADPLVSRRHCELSLVGNAPYIRDLNSSNTTLVNGAPLRSGVLSPGDQVCIGNVVFIVSAIAAKPDAIPDNIACQATLKLSETDAVYYGSADQVATSHGPGTLEDIVLLLNLTDAFGRSETRSQLIREIDSFLVSRFAPQACWIITFDGPNDSRTLHPTHTYPNEDQETPDELIEHTLNRREGVLSPKRVHRNNGTAIQFQMAAPILWHRHVTGVIAVRGESPQHMYDENDLHMLVSTARAVAPFFHAIDARDALRRENERLREAVHNTRLLVGESEALAHIRTLLTKVAPTQQPVLITGETGTGKELLAHLVHDLSSRSSGPFVVVNCAAIPKDLFESQFFGHEKGAFTGATAQRLGLLEESHHGTLFLDEVGDLSLENQARILRAIETGVFRRVGGAKDIHCDFRVVSATNRDIGEATSKGQFRTDLYHRLCGIEICVPPLRDRPEDITALAEYFLEEARVRSGVAFRGYAPDAIDYLLQQPWPGNVRQLRQTILTASILASDLFIDVASLQAAQQRSVFAQPSVSLDDVERNHIIRVLELTDHNIGRAAELLKVSRSALYEKTKKYGIRQ